MGIPWGALATGAASGYADFAQGQQQGQDRALQLALTMAGQKQKQEQADLQRRLGQATIERERAVAGGRWRATGDGMHEINDITGEIRVPPANGGLDAIVSAASRLPVGLTPSGAPRPSPSMDGIRDSQDMTGGDGLPATQPVTPSAPVQDTTPKPPLNFGRPVAPKAPPRIDPNSQAAIDAKQASKIATDSARVVNTQKAKVTNPTPSKVAGYLTPDAKAKARGDFIARQIPALMKPQPGKYPGTTVPSKYTTADDAAAEAGRRWDVAHGIATPTTTAPAPAPKTGKAPSADPFADIPTVKKPEDDELE